jgi:thioester reductase-like protein
VSAASMSGDVLLTGATGFVGMELLARYLERSQRRVITLVRADGSDGARARVDSVLENLFGSRAHEHRDRVEAVAADMTLPGMGLPTRVRDQLAERVTTIVHSAASVSFTLPLQEAREINVAGTRHMLEFAELARERGGLECYGHISTAYVAGNHSGRFYEHDLDVGQTFHNSYEQSKFEAEQLVRAHTDLPATIMRPSIVVGDQRNGWTSAFNVLYWPLRAFARGLFTAVPAIPTAPVDVVSVDYVADAVHALCESGRSAGATYHLTAGPNASTIDEIAGLASRYFRRPQVQVLPPAEYAARPACGAAEQSAIQAGAQYFPYFSIGTVFESEATRARLEPEGIRASPLREYMERLLDFATRSRWGKRPITRVDAFAR